MYSRGRVRGVCVCINLPLVCAAASSGAASSWARPRRAQLSRGTLEIMPEKGWKSVTACVCVCEGSQRRDATRRASSLSTQGARALLPQSVRSRGGQVQAFAGKKGEL